MVLDFVAVCKLAEWIQVSDSANRTIYRRTIADVYLLSMCGVFVCVCLLMYVCRRLYLIQSNTLFVVVSSLIACGCVCEQIYSTEMTQTLTQLPHTLVTLDDSHSIFRCCFANSAGASRGHGMSNSMYWISSIDFETKQIQNILLNWWPFRHWQ